MSLSPQRRTVSFIVRLWAEYLEADPPSWRGVIEAVGCEQAGAFSDVQEIGALIQEMTKTHKEDHHET